MSNAKMIEVLNNIDQMNETQLRDVIEYAMDTLVLLNIAQATAPKSETA